MIVQIGVCENKDKCWLLNDGVEAISVLEFGQQDMAGKSMSFEDLEQKDPVRSRLLETWSLDCIVCEVLHKARSPPESV